MDDLALAITDLVVGFDRQVKLVVPEFRLAQGDRCLITGPSGTGKTVFLGVLLGQAPPARVWGGRFRVRLAGREEDLDYAAYRSRPWLAENTAVVFQDAMHSLHPYRSIEAQCPARPADYAALNLDPDYVLSSAFRARCAAPGESPAPGGPRFVGDLSGGERQRISLLFPQVQRERRLLVLDEPLTDIDPISILSVRAAIEALLADSGPGPGRRRAVVLVTHQTDWLAPESLHHYRLHPEDGEGPARLLDAGPGPRRGPPVPKVPPPVPAAAGGGTPGRTDGAVFSLGLARPYRLGADSGFRLWPFTPLELGAGETLGLIGESGSGKSTLLRAAAGLLPAGAYRRDFDLRLRLAGAQLEPLMGLSRRCRYGRVQYVSQDSTGSLIAAERVGRHLEWIRRHKGAARDAFRERVDDWARALRLYRDATGRERFLDLRHQALSMGQKRRYGLLRAFLLLDIHGPDAAQSPKLLLLDEISRGLDAEALDGLVEVLHRFACAYNVAMLVVSHDMAFIRRTCARLRMVFNGALLPSPIRSEDLAVMTPDGAPLADPDLNPYYRHFLESRDLGPDLRLTPEERRAQPLDRYTGCLLRHYIRCPAERRADPACVHRTLQLSEPHGAVGICQ